MTRAGWFGPVLCALALAAGCKAKEPGTAADAGASGARAGAGGAGSPAAGSGEAGEPAAGSGGAGSPAAGSGGAGRAGAGAGGAAAGSAGAAAGSGGGSGSGAGAGGDGARYPTDRSKFFGASRCDASFLLCDDFEGGTIDTSTWKNKNSAPSIDSTRAARGSKSLHMKTTATGVSGLETSKIFPRALYYGRMFVYFMALPTKPQWAHWTVVGANPKAGSGMTGEARLGGQYDGKRNLFGVGTDQGPTGDWTNLDADPAGAVKAVPLGEWICLEWMHDSTNDISKVWWDGVEHPSLGTTRDVKHMGNAGVKYDIPDLASVWVGFWNYDQGQAVTPNGFDTWIDEVALDDARIGCGL